MNHKKSKIGFIFFVAIGLLFSCAVERGVNHTVKEGETLWEISQAYDVNLNILLRLNEIKDPRAVKPGEVLIIPGRSAHQKADRTSPSKQTRISPTKQSTDPSKGKSTVKRNQSTDEHKKENNLLKSTKTSEDLSQIKETFNPVWPCKGRLVSRFEKKGSPTKRGVRIHVPSETLVRAAEDGIVKLAGKVEQLSKLGNIVIIYHRNDIATVYAHLDSLRVEKGSQVKKRAPLGVVGTTGNVEQSSCYFEIRYKLEPRDPLIFLGEPT